MPLYRLFLLVLLVCPSIIAPLEAADEPIDYQLRLVDGPRIVVSIRIQGDADGQTNMMSEKEWGGNQNDGSDVSNLEVFNGKKEQKGIERLNSTSWRIDHEPNEKLTVRYSILPTKPREPVMGNDHRTQLTADLFQMVGHLGLLVPERENKQESFQFRIQMVGFKEAGWTSVTSFGKGDGIYTMEGTFNDLLHSMWMAGKFEFVERKIGDNTIGIAIAGKDWRFAKEQLADSVEKIIRAERDFFKDHSDPWYLVTLSPIQSTDPHSNSLGGTALKNCFSMYCSKNFSMQGNPQEPNRGLLLLAHEYFHNWNGIKIPTAGGDPQTYWLSEGFTNFYARRILLRMGMITKKEFLASLNEELQKYETNEAKSYPNQRIVEGFWSSRKVQELPYQRGALVALLMDEHLRTRSKGKQSLDDFMLDLFQNKPIAPVTSRALLERIGKWVDDDFREQLRAIVEVGGGIDLPRRLTEPSCRLGKAKVKTFDPGFSLEKAQQTKQIEGVKEDGNAYRAGLRNGQKIRTLSIFEGNDPKAEIEVMDDGKIKSIKYEAVSEFGEISAYELD